LSSRRAESPLMRVLWTTEVYPGLEVIVRYSENPKNPYDGLISKLVCLSHAFDEKVSGEFHKCAWVRVYEDLLDPDLPWYVQQELVDVRKMIRLKDYDVRRPYRQRSKKQPMMGRLYYNL
jgi:hypothetical protein